MTASEIFTRLDPETNEHIFVFLQNEDRHAYRSTMQILASRRNLRPVFLEKKTKPERHRWMGEALGRNRNEDLALELLQNWVLRGRRDMVLQFLRDLDIVHDGEGIIQTTPDEPAQEAVEAAVNNLLANFPPTHATVYLHLFASMEDEGWPHLRHLLATEPRLQLEPAPAI
jgi:hypothetical protein